MRRETVPIDTSSEQKSILGIISTRQLIYLIGGGSTLYAIIPPVFKMMPNFITGALFSVMIAIPVIAIVVVFGFLKKMKFHMNMDQYLMIKFGMKNQMGIWRKGKHNEDWMVRK